MSENIYNNLLSSVQKTEEVNQNVQVEEVVAGESEVREETEVEEVVEEEVSEVETVPPKWEDQYDVEPEVTNPVPEVQEIDFTNKEKENVRGLVFTGDSYLTKLNPSLYSVNEEDTLSIPIDQKDLYKVKVDVNNVEETIENAFKTNPRRVSFALEELGLHNRLIEMGGVPQEFDNFVLVKTKLGNVVVHKIRNSMGDIERDFMREAEKCLVQGKRIVIPLVENYKFKDGFGVILTRSRYRASFGEIKNFVARTQMQSQITKDSYLIIYE